jgi:YdjC-like protein
MAGEADGPSAAAPSARLPGFPPDARVLIVNSDDFGMYHAINAAVLRSVKEGISSSCSLISPGLRSGKRSWSPHWFVAGAGGETSDYLPSAMTAMPSVLFVRRCLMA